MKRPESLRDVNTNLMLKKTHSFPITVKSKGKVQGRGGVYLNSSQSLDIIKTVHILRLKHAADVTSFARAEYSSSDISPSTDLINHASSTTWYKLKIYIWGSRGWGRKPVVTWGGGDVIGRRGKAEAEARDPSG
jgi:hypothetical protein